VAALGLAATAFSASALATVVAIPDSALVPSGQYYTDMIGGGIGSPLIMTGGENEANVGSSRSDDGFSGPISLGFSLTFFGQTYTQFWANNNGNISFTGGIAAYTPTGPQGAPQPIISPFFADVDTTNPQSGLMYLRNDIPNEIIVTWDAVGRFDSDASQLDSFQLVLRGPGYDIPQGQGAIGFFYKDMQWERGSISGTSAAVGFGDGAGNGEVLAGSTQSGIAGIVSNHYVWFDQNLTPVPPPTSVAEPRELPLMLLGLLGIGGLVWRRRRCAA
jgi:MYXO-CTERM domain-containing protein